MVLKVMKVLKVMMMMMMMMMMMVMVMVMMVMMVMIVMMVMMKMVHTPKGWLSCIIFKNNKRNFQVWSLLPMDHLGSIKKKNGKS